jgi:hypothetical protein
MTTTMGAADQARASQGPPEYLTPGRASQGPPPEYLTLTGIEEVSGRELAERRTRLLAGIGSAEPGTPGALPAALALAAVIAAQDVRATVYANSPDAARGCACGFTCTSLAALDAHLDQFPVDDRSHEEL